MESKAAETFRDEVLAAEKRERQERSRALVRSGQRSQESMFFISREIAKTLKVYRRTDEF